MNVAADHSQSYGADPLLAGFWVLLAAIPVPIATWGLVKNGATATSVEMVLVSLIGPLAVFVFTSRFRAVFHADHFEYRRWGPTIRARYTDIAAIEIANVTPVEGQPIGAFIVTRDGRRLPFWPKLFPREAVERFLQLAAQSNSL
jgi:hypothetical protein